MSPAAQPSAPAGAYEKIAGKIFFAVDPSLPANRIVADIDKAPRNARRQGRVLVRFLPAQAETDRTRQRRRAVRSVEPRREGDARVLQSRRGQHRPDDGRADGRRVPDEAGFTLLWVGLAVRRAEASRPGAGVSTDRLGQRHVRFAAWCAAISSSPNAKPIIRSPIAITPPIASSIRSPDNVLTVRDTVEGPRRIVPRSQWGFGARRRRQASPRDPRVLTANSSRTRSTKWSTRRRIRRSWDSGPRRSATRSSLLKYGRRTRCRFRPARSRARTAFGISQSGRFLRKYLYYGFNRDEGEPQGVRRRDCARRRRRTRQLQPPLRSAVARWPPVPQLLLPDRYLPVHRRAQNRSGDRRHRWPADACRRARAAAENVLHELRLRVLGPRRVADSHHSRRHAPTRR